MIVQEKWAAPLMNWRLWAPPTVMSVFLIIVADYSFLGFHTLAELFAVIISYLMFALAWFTYGFSKNNFLLFLACGYFWIGSLDLVHTLVYKGMDVFVQGSGNLSVQFWVGTRLSEALLLLAAPFAATRMQNRNLLVAAFGAVAVALTALIMSGNFPTGFVEGQGLTSFKIYSEYLIDLILALALVSLFRYGAGISKTNKVIIAASILMTMGAELAFTFYVDVYGLSNLAGHILRLFSFWFIFQAIVVSNLHEPYAALQQSESRIYSILNSTAEAIYGLDIEGKCTFCNPAGVRMLRYQSEDELLGRHMHDLNEQRRGDNGDGAATGQCRICQAFRRGRDYHLDDTTLWRKDGTSFPAEYWSYPIRRDGKVVGSVATFLDITERKHLESQLRQSQRMDVIGQLTGGVAHDFNNLLSVMLGNAEMLGDLVAGDEKAKHHIEALEKAVYRAASLTNRLLAFSRRQTLSPVSTDITGLVSGLEDMLRRTLGETIDLKVEASPNLWPAIIDQHQFENALVNLAINARDAMPGGGALTIETANTTLDEIYAMQFEEVTPGDYVRVAVSDTGAGIAPDILNRVFEPFFTTKAVGEGSGLGLSMVYGFTKQSNGHITIYSEPGHGTTVKLYVPRSAQAARKETARKAPETAPGCERILVVEDDDSLREVPVSILRGQGYQVVEAANGEQAIKRLIEYLKKGKPFDLLFTDIILPGGMNGVDIAERADKLQPGIKVLYTTGYAENSVVHNGRLAAGVVLVNKPYLRAELLAKIRLVLD